MSSINRFKYHLMDMKKRVDNFSGRNKLTQLVKERLDKTLKLYEQELDNAFDEKVVLSPVKVLRSINRRD